MKRPVDAPAGEASSACEPSLRIGDTTDGTDPDPRPKRPRHYPGAVSARRSVIDKPGQGRFYAKELGATCKKTASKILWCAASPPKSAVKHQGARWPNEPRLRCVVMDDGRDSYFPTSTKWA